MTEDQVQNIINTHKEWLTDHLKNAESFQPEVMSLKTIFSYI